MGFPTNNQFTPITVSGSIYADVVRDINPARTDIVGDENFPSFYFAYDTINVYFRMRVRADPRNRSKTSFANSAWGLLLNTSGVAGTYDWLLAVNGLRNKLNLIQNVVKEVNSWNDPAEGTNGRGEPNYSREIVNFDVARVVQADSTLGDSQNFFIDFLIPASTFFSFLEITPNDPVQMLAFSSESSNNYNKDSLRVSEGYQFRDALSDPVTINSGNVKALLQITKEVSTGPQTPIAGQNYEWTGKITLTNIGKSQATILNVIDAVSLDVVSSLTVSSVTQGSTAFNGAAKTLTWTVGDLEAGESATLNFIENGLFYTSGEKVLNRAAGIGYDLFTGGELVPVTSVVTVDVQATGGAAGNVLNSINGQPVDNVVVRLLSGATEIAVTQTDLYGDYNFTNIAPGTYNIEFSKADFNTLVQPVAITASNVTVVNTFLTPVPGNLEGTVTSEGAGISGASVLLADNLGNVVVQTSTSPTGQYSFSGIQPGHYTLSVTADNFQSQTIGQNVILNQTSTSNFVLVPNPGTVQGTITGSGGPLAGALVEVLSSTGLVVAADTADGAGQYVINKLTPGSYRLRASSAAFQTSIIGFSVLAGQTVEVDVNLLPNPGALTGTVSDEESGVALPGTSLKIVNSFGLTSASVTTDGSGQYFVDSLAPGNYVITFAAEGRGTKTVGAYVQSDETTTLNVSLKRLVGVLSGIVSSDGVSVSGAKIDVVSNNIVIAKTVSDENGEYTINGLSPGRYTIIFTADGYSTVTLGALIENNQTFLLNAELQSLFGALSGNVTDNVGNVLPGTVILVKNSDSDVLVARRVIDPGGNYLVTDLNPGSYIVSASLANYQTLLGGAIITAGDTSELDFILAPNPSSIIGTVINLATNTPIINESIKIQLVDSNGVIITTTFSNADGEFIFENVLPSTYTINASADGFRSSYASVKTDPGAVVSTSIGLEPLPGFITGTLTDQSTGLPIAGATINISNALGFQVDTMLTSTNGQFLSTGLPAGIYTLAVVAEGYETNLVGEIVPPGFTKSINIQLSPNPGSISGTVSPVADNLVIQLYSMDNQLVNSTAANPSGNFQFQNLAPGNYILKAAAINYSIACTGAFVESGNDTNVSLTIKPNPGSISGRVTSDLGDPLPNATVSLVDSNETPIAFGNTDINGNYYIGNVPPGSYALVVKLMMYTTTTGTVSVAPGQDVTNVDFVMLRPRGTISGGVADFNTGQVIPGASILLRNSLGILIKFTTTDQFGKFLFRNIGPDSYTVTSSAPNYSTEITGVIVQSDETSGVNVLLKTLVGNLRGQVTDPNGDPLSGDNIQVKLLGANGELLQALLAQPDGSFLIPSLSAGTYFVSAFLEGYTSNLVSVIIEPGVLNALSIPLSPILTTLSGRVFDSETGNPIFGTAVTLSLTKKTGVFVDNQYPSELGLFSFHSISPGIYVLNVNAEGYGNVAQTITVPEEGFTINIPLTKSPGAVTGYVTNQLSSEPLNNAVVTIVKSGKSLENRAVTDGSGQFTVPNLSPGSYRAVVTAVGFSSQSATFEILPDQTTSLSFILTPEPGDIVGTVTDITTGEPIRGVNIQVRYLTPAGPVYASTLTDDQGIYQTQGLYAGTYTIIAFAENSYGSSSASVIVLAGGTRTIDFSLEPFPAVVEGIIRDETTGEAVPNVFVRLLDIHGSSIQIVNSDVKGFYRFEGFTAGQYLVSAISPNYQRVQVSINPLPGETIIADLFFKPEPGRISGVILDAETGSPLVGAQVEVFSPGSTTPVARRTAGASGNFLIEGVAPGSFTINGYTLNYSIESKGIVVNPNETTSVEFLLTPEPSSISGIVVDTIGQLLSNVSVRIVDENEVEVGNGISDVDGNFSIGNLPSGSFTVIAGIEDYSEFTTGISVPPGQEYSNLEVVMSPLGGTFSGSVVSAETGEGLAGVLISILSPEGIPIISTNTGTSGLFVSPLLTPGMYTVIGSSPNYIQEQTGVIVEAGESSNVSFSLQSIGGKILGSVVDDNGNPIINTTVTIRLLNNTGVLLQTLQGLTDGKFEITNLASGTYQVNVIAEGYQTETVGALVVNGEVSTLIVPLTEDGGILTGLIQDEATGLPISGSFVEITDANGILVATITSDQNGEFRFQTIQTGPLNVKATAPNYGSSTIGVIVNSGELSNVSLTLSPLTGLFDGTITDPEGVPISNSTIKVIDETNTTITTVLSDEDGSYQIRELTPDRYTITANADGFGKNIVTGLILPDEETVIDIVLLPEGGFVQGRVTDEVTGAPQIGVSAELRSISPFGPVINTVLTDSDGNYSFGFVSIGTYTLIVSKKNFGSKSGSILVENAVTSIQDFVLKPNPASIAGVVSSEGLLLENILVRLIDTNGANVAEVQTDEQGRYLLQNFSPGIYSLLVRNSNYQTATKGFTAGAGETAQADFELIALPGAITGKVIDQQTDLPISGAIVQVVYGDSVQPAGRAITDPSGIYTIAGLSPGGYSILITTPNYNTYSAGATVRPNDATSIDGFLSPNPGVVTGIVSGPTGALTGAGVKVIDINGSVIGFSVTDDSGSFSIGNLPTGTYAITVVAPNHNSDMQGVTITPGEIETIQSNLTPEPGAITGNVRDENGTPLPGTVVNVLLNGLILGSVVTDDNGDYLFSNLLPNSYQISAVQPGFTLSSVGAIVSSDSTTTTNVILEQLFGNINGTVTDQNGKPITKQTIFINLFDQNSSFITSVIAEPDGTYDISGVKAGDYLITATAKGYNPNTFAVSVESGAVNSINLPLEAIGGSLSVQVINITGLPVSGVITDVYTSAGIPITSAVTNQNGRSRVDKVAKGSVVISIISPNYSNVSQGAIIKNGVTTEAVLTILPEKGELTGIITDPNGIAISGAVIQILDDTRSVVTTVLTQSDGRYAVRDLLLGIYTMNVSAPDFEQKSLSAFIEAGETTVTNLELALLPGSVEGVATDAGSGAFIARTNVELRLISSSGPVVKTTLTDTQGSYRFSSVPAGNYTVVATNRNYGNDSDAIVVLPGVTAFSDLQLSPVTASVSGRVTDSDDSQPLVNTLLRLANRNGVVVAEVQTDIDGNYLIEGLLPGEFSLTAINQDYRSSVISFTASPNTTNTVTFNMNAIPSVFSGFVTDADTGLPIVGAIVETYDLLNRPIAVALTNIEGFYTIPGLSNGTYTLRASAQGYGSEGRQSDILVNETKVENFALPGMPASISGTVTIAGNGPLINAQVNVYNDNGVLVGSTFTNEDGNYLVGNLSAGSYTVTADAEGYLEQSIDLTLATGENRTGINFALSPGADGDITGQVSDSRTGLPLAGVLIQLFELNGELVRGVTTNNAGVFLLRGVRAGAYELRASAAGYETFSTQIELLADEELVLPISLKAINPVPPSLSAAFYYIVSGGQPLSLDSTTSPTLFALERIDSARNTATFSYEAIVEGTSIRRFITFDLMCIDLMRVFI
jgi:protocatechuate 3,4-dioxygenase beta subunit